MTAMEDCCDPILPYDESHLRRKADPPTCAEAAAAIVPQLHDLRKWAAFCVGLYPGWTQRQLGVRCCPDDPRRIGRRLKECEQDGTVRRGEKIRCPISGRSAETWWPVTEAL